MTGKEAGDDDDVCLKRRVDGKVLVNDELESAPCHANSIEVVLFA